MVTKAALRKISKEYDLLSEMESRGFEEAENSKLVFFRKKDDDLYQIIEFEILRGGENLRITVFNWLPELHEEYEIRNFPKALKITNGGYITRGNVIGRGAKLWDLREAKNMKENIEDILRNIDKVAVPWLNSITNRRDLVDAIFLDLKENVQFDALKSRILN